MDETSNPIGLALDFDDHPKFTARLEDISPALVRRFLHRTSNQILDVKPPLNDLALYRKLRIIAPVNSHEAPRNVGLLFFNE